MERTPFSKEAPRTTHAKHAKPKLKKVAPSWCVDNNDKLRSSSLRLGLAALAAILAAPAAGCGGQTLQETPDAEPPRCATADGGFEPACICATQERAEAPAPRVTVQTNNITLKKNRLRIGFDVPPFDQRCRAPFTVRARAMVWSNPEKVPLGEEPSGEPLSSPGELLPGETEVHKPGPYFLDAEFPPHAARISSLVLEVMDAAGQEYATPPFSPLE